MAEEGKDPEIGSEQSLVSHLLELRDRLLRMIMAVAIVFAALFYFSNDIYTMVARPLMDQLPDGASMIATQVAAPFLIPFKLTLIISVYLAMPVILYQFWGFVAPGLYRHERRLVLPLVASSAVLFYVGMLFAYFAVFPLIFRFLTAVAPEGVAVMTDISEYLDFVLTLFFAFGLAFEVPIATILLVWIGVTTRESLLKKRPYIIVGAFGVGMLLTPPDVISQSLLAVPMWMLFEAGVFFSRFFVRESGDEDEGREHEPRPTPGPTAGKGSTSAPRPEPTPPPRPPGYDAVAAVATASQGTGFRPMTEEEMDAELDRIEEEEAAPGTADKPSTGPGSDGGPGDAGAAAKLERVMELRDQGKEALARALLHEVLREGDEDQVMVARNILKQLDEDA